MTTTSPLPVRDALKIINLHALGGDDIAAGVLAERPHVITWMRHAAGISQTKLAHELGCTQATVSRWESRDRRPSPALAVRALRFLLDRIDGGGL